MQNSSRVLDTHSSDGALIASGAAALLCDLTSGVSSSANTIMVLSIGVLEELVCHRPDSSSTNVSNDVGPGRR